MNVLNTKIKLLVVDDSAVQRELLVHIFNSDPAIQVVGLAENGIEALEMLKKTKPDVILMDLHMPKMNGIEAIRHIMTTNPLPIVAVSASNNLNETINDFHALEAGAVAFAEKPKSIQHPQYELLRTYLLQTVKLMSEVKVVRRWHELSQSKKKCASAKNITVPLITKNIQLIAIGVSTGGPIVLQTILSQLPIDFPPILIVQHIAPGFVQGLAQWLSQVTHRQITIATNGEFPKRGHVYLAPDHYHMGILSNGRIYLQAPNDGYHGLCPSIDFLFSSVANVIKDKAMGILLTGMGSDGAIQLKKMKEAGAITIAQNEETSLIYGMPAQAVALEAVLYILTPEEIAQAISSLTGSKGYI